MLKNYTGYKVPFYIVMLKHAGYCEADSLNLKPGEFFSPVFNQLIVCDMQEGDTPNLFSDFDNMNKNLAGSDNYGSSLYLDIMLDRIPDKVNKSNLDSFVNTYGKN
jgi:hypothetical protein